MYREFKINNLICVYGLPNLTWRTQRIFSELILEIKKPNTISSLLKCCQKFWNIIREEKTLMGFQNEWEKSIELQTIILNFIQIYSHLERVIFRRRKNCFSLSKMTSHLGSFNDNNYTIFGRKMTLNVCHSKRWRSL